MAVDFFTFAHPYMLTFDPRQDGLTPGALEVLRKEPQPFRYARGTSLKLPAGEGMVTGLDCLEGIEPNVPARFRKAFWMAQLDLPPGEIPSPEWTPPATTMYYLMGIAPALRVMNLTHLVQYTDSDLVPMRGAREVYRDSRIRIICLPSPYPRAWIVHRARVVQSPDDACAMLATPSRWHYEREAIFEAPPACPLALPRLADPTPRFIRYGADHVVIEADPAADGLLIVSDLFYPGWKAAVDGRPVEILRANYLMRAIPVPAGKHIIEMRYDPRSFKIGLILSALGCVAVAGLLWTHRRRSRLTRK